MATVKSIDEYRGISSTHTPTRLSEHPSSNPRKNPLRSLPQLIPGEDPTELSTLIDEIDERFDPRDIVELTMVDMVIHNAWRLRRYARLKTQLLERLRSDDFEAQDKALRAMEHNLDIATKMHDRSLRAIERHKAARQPKPRSRPPRRGPRFVRARRPASARHDEQH